MGFFDRLKRKNDAGRMAEANKITQTFQRALYTNPLCSEYENFFAQLRPLINDMKMVVPYGVGGNGARLAPSRTPELEILKYPNADMGWGEFADAMFATWLSKPELNVRVHRNRRGKIIGYTLLNGASKEQRADGEYYWRTNKEVLSQDEVLTLMYSRNPSNLAQGVSPAQAARVWAQIDDLVAQFQRAYFQNGAVPAFVTTITASNAQKYQDIRNSLERNLKGSNNAHKTIYIWQHYQPVTGETAKEVEITPIQGNNSTMAIGEIVKVINDRMNKAVGVSNFILGDDSSAKYSNAELSNQQFIKRRVYPALVSFWSQFQHELDRITGGLGYAIQFDLPIPELTERRHANALINKENAETLRDLIGAGSDPLNACKAIGIDSDAWKQVAIGIHRQHVDELEAQAQQIALPPLTDAKPGTEHVEDVHKHHHHENDAYVPFTDEEKTERKIFDQLIGLAEAIFAENPNIDTQGVVNEIVRLLIDEADKGELEAARIINELMDDDDIMSKIEARLKEDGKLVSDDFANRLETRTKALVDGYDKQTREVMRSVLESAAGYTKEEIQERLANRIPNGKAATIARNETVYAFKSGRLEMDKSLANEYDLDIELTWHTSKDGDVCPLCAAMEGKKVVLGKSFKPEAVTEDGKTSVWSRNAWNDFGEIPNAHTNCRCYFDEKIIRKGK